MKPIFVALVYSGIVLLPVQSLAENRSRPGASEPTVNGRTAREIGATSNAKRGTRTAEPSELNALVGAQDKVLERKLRSICRGC